jgi:hypothetical protein
VRLIVLSAIQPGIRVQMGTSNLQQSQAFSTSVRQALLSQPPTWEKQSYIPLVRTPRDYSLPKAFKFAFSGRCFTSSRVGRNPTFSNAVIGFCLSSVLRLGLDLYLSPRFKSYSLSCPCEHLRKRKCTRMHCLPKSLAWHAYFMFILVTYRSSSSRLHSHLFLKKILTGAAKSR